MNRASRGPDAGDPERGGQGSLTPPSERVAELYHHFFTGLLLRLLTHRGAVATATFVEAFFRSKQEEQFLPGLEKLGLTGLPPAIACARYHYLANAVGGVHVEYIEESPTKAWVRYPPPRWIWHGAAIAAIPSDVSAAMLRGWHSRNGLSLANRRLAFVCTGQTVDGQPGLEGYFEEQDRELDDSERLQFRPEESAPRFDPSSAPLLPSASWPQERREKAYRNYAMDYFRTAVALLVDLWGSQEALELAVPCARNIGLQLYRDTRGSVRPARDPRASAEAFARLFVELASAQGDEAGFRVGDDSVEVWQSSWRILRGNSSPDPSFFEVWNTLLAGLALAHDRFLEWRIVERLDQGDSRFTWEVAGTTR